LQTGEGENTAKGYGRRASLFLYPPSPLAGFSQTCHCLTLTARHSGIDPLLTLIVLSPLNPDTVFPLLPSHRTRVSVQVFPLPWGEKQSSKEEAELRFIQLLS
ncbi:ABC transporter C family member 8, partial [Dissostichus eleginoides]